MLYILSSMSNIVVAWRKVLGRKPAISGCPSPSGSERAAGHPGGPGLWMTKQDI